MKFSQVHKGSNNLKSDGAYVTAAVQGHQKRQKYEKVSMFVSQSNGLRRTSVPNTVRSIGNCSIVDSLFDIMSMFMRLWSLAT
mmetsp:Transcript_22103/g.46237  ORF Transcript_22103/g.46237 Transcript_22103/m.46237 type:complete len:83 (+) Transcript_22103:1454-1702(+)